MATTARGAVSYHQGSAATSYPSTMAVSYLVSSNCPINTIFPASSWQVNLSDPLHNLTTLRAREKLPLLSSVVLILLYTLTTIAAVCGNSLAILVFARGRRSNTDLRHFLLNLAIADLIMAIFCIPFTLAYQMADNWIFSSFMCRVVQGCQVVSVTASVSTNTAIGIDRLMAVKFPLRSRVTNSRSKLFIMTIWIFAILLGSIPVAVSRTVSNREGKVTCEEHFKDEDIRVVYGFFITVVTYFLPVVILSVTYIMIGKLLWRHKLPGNADDHRDAVQLKSKKKVVKMLITIVLLFSLCWLPLHVFITVTLTFKKNVFGDQAYKVYFAVHWLSMANSFVNPLIYGFMNDNFRADLKCLAESCPCLTSGRSRLKYRPAALRRRVAGTKGRNLYLACPHSFQHTWQHPCPGNLSWSARDSHHGQDCLCSGPPNLQEHKQSTPLQTLTEAHTDKRPDLDMIDS